MRSLDFLLFALCHSFSPTFLFCRWISYSLWMYLIQLGSMWLFCFFVNFCQKMYCLVVCPKMFSPFTQTLISHRLLFSLLHLWTELRYENETKSTNTNFVVLIYARVYLHTHTKTIQFKSHSYVVRAYTCTHTDTQTTALIGELKLNPILAFVELCSCYSACWYKKSRAFQFQQKHSLARAHSQSE